jgi:hypothetical protein
VCLMSATMDSTLLTDYFSSSSASSLAATELQQSCNRAATELQQGYSSSSIGSSLAATELQQSCNRAATELQQDYSSSSIGSSLAATLLQQSCNRAATELQQDYSSSSIGSSPGPVPRVSGTQFTCFTSTKVQILTLPLARRPSAARVRYSIYLLY